LRDLYDLQTDYKRVYSYYNWTSLGSQSIMIGISAFIFSDLR